MKTILVAMLLVFFDLSLLGWAEQAAAPAVTNIVDAGNTICPVSGDKVNPKVTYVFEGKRYAFCCPMCVKKFKKDPKKYLAQMAQGKFDSQMQQEMQEGPH